MLMQENSMLPSAKTNVVPKEPRYGLSSAIAKTRLNSAAVTSIEKSPRFNIGPYPSTHIPQIAILDICQHGRREFQSRMERKQMKEFMGMFSNLVTHCFDSCIDDFTTKSLIQRETGCVTRCVQKFMAGSERIGQRFQEQQAQMMSQPPPGR
ncbi:related to translocase of inner membrane [Rhynchosporium graminicola]|uniref:Mitochondrial import inner membrane translocase subunit TIM9 n=1 Tax=Rhynchosporium graminicola TaxID=2792576 RepID=A0A1E1KW80_9HELO|nr:related to translocase of inner membrane [Rhynchosporium commune]